MFYQPQTHAYNENVKSIALLCKRSAYMHMTYIYMNSCINHSRRRRRRHRCSRRRLQSTIHPPQPPISIASILVLHRFFPQEQVMAPAIALLWPAVVMGAAVAAAAAVYAQDYDRGGVPPAVDNCIGIFLSYTFQSREKAFPKVKNTTAQAWAFKSVASIVNAGDRELKLWKMFIRFQH